MRCGIITSEIKVQPNWIQATMWPLPMRKTNTVWMTTKGPDMKNLQQPKSEK